MNRTSIENRPQLMAWLLGVIVGLVGQVPVPAADMTFTEVRPGVFAALQPADERFDESNSTVIVNEKDVIVVDAQANSERVLEIIAWLEKAELPPVRYVVNTHWHADHTAGNAVYQERYGEAVTFVGHQSLVEDVPQRAQTGNEEDRERLSALIPKAKANLAQGLGLSGQALDEETLVAQRVSIARAEARLKQLEAARWVVPNLLYEERLSFRRGEREIRLLHFVAHTRGDTVVFMPQEKVLVTGDLLDDLPFGGHGYVEEWVEALGAIEALDFEVIIPGHGEVRQGKDHLRRVKKLFELVLDHAARSVALGHSVEQAKESFDAGALKTQLIGSDPVAERNWAGFVLSAVERAFAEASQAAKSVTPALSDGAS